MDSILYSLCESFKVRDIEITGIETSGQGPLNVRGCEVAGLAEWFPVKLWSKVSEFVYSSGSSFPRELSFAVSGVIGIFTAASFFRHFDRGLCKVKGLMLHPNFNFCQCVFVAIFYAPSCMPISKVGHSNA